MVGRTGDASPLSPAVVTPLVIVTVVTARVHPVHLMNAD